MARVLCTYGGTGTQYGIFTDGDKPSRVFTVQTGAPILLRGPLWLAHPPSGLLHRSPPIEGTGETRLVLVLDPVFDLDDDGPWPAQPTPETALWRSHGRVRQPASPVEAMVVRSCVAMVSRFGAADLGEVAGQGPFAGRNADVAEPDRSPDACPRPAINSLQGECAIPSERLRPLLSPLTRWTSELAEASGTAVTSALQDSFERRGTTLRKVRGLPRTLSMR
jgi:hypothetical protein